VQLDTHGGDHAEVPATATQRPEQLGVMFGIDGDRRSVGEHHVGRQQIVGGKAESTAQRPVTTAECQAGHAHRAGRPGHGDQTGSLRGGRNVSRGRPARHGGNGGAPIDAHLPHRAQVECQPAVGQRAAGPVVPAPTDRQRKALFPGGPNSRLDVSRVGTPKDGGRAVGHRAVPDRHSRLVLDPRSQNVTHVGRVAPHSSE
jgi:hypothetical protein